MLLHAFYGKGGPRPPPLYFLKGGPFWEKGGPIFFVRSLPQKLTLHHIDTFVMQVSWLGSKQSNEIIIFIIIWTEKFYSMIYDLILVNIWKKLFFGVLSFLENEISVKILWNVARSAASPPCSHGILGAITELQIIHNTIHRSQTFLWIFHTIFSYKFAFLAKKAQNSLGAKLSVQNAFRIYQEHWARRRREFLKI